MMDFRSRLESARDIPDVFELVKLAVLSVEGRSRAGLNLGLADLGEGANAWIGGFHVIASDTIVLNSRPLDHVRRNSPNMYNSYVFFVLLHEYLHSLGYVDELECRRRTLCVAEQLFGPGDLVTDLARDVQRYLPHFRQVEYGWMPPADHTVRYVRGFDRGSTGYFT
ncbi:MAG: hypothetical protein Kow0069_21280 [Promethearchaeota archaeon]